MVLSGLTTVSPASMDKPGHSLCYGIGRAIAAASPDFYHFSAQPMARLSEAFGPGFDPSLPRSDFQGRKT